MLGEKRVPSRNEIIEEVKELSDEESESNKMLSLPDSTENEKTSSKKDDGISKEVDDKSKESSFDVL